MAPIRTPLRIVAGDDQPDRRRRRARAATRNPRPRSTRACGGAPVRRSGHRHSLVAASVTAAAAHFGGLCRSRRSRLGSMPARSRTIPATATRIADASSSSPPPARRCAAARTVPASGSTRASSADRGAGDGGADERGRLAERDAPGDGDRGHRLGVGSWRTAARTRRAATSSASAERRQRHGHEVAERRHRRRRTTSQQDVDGHADDRRTAPRRSSSAGAAHRADRSSTAPDPARRPHAGDARRPAAPRPARDRRAGQHRVRIGGQPRHEHEGPLGARADAAASARDRR